MMRPGVPLGQAAPQPSRVVGVRLPPYGIEYNSQFCIDISLILSRYIVR